MTERKTKVIKLIYDNPGLTGNELYKQAKKEGYGIKKSDFYQTIRTVRKLPEPTLEKKEKSIPLQYRKPIKPIRDVDDLPIPKKRGAYGIVEIIVKDPDKEYWIKYETKESLKKQLNNLKKKYKLKAIKIKFHGFGSYATFIDEEFKKLLESVGINL